MTEGYAWHIKRYSYNYAYGRVIITLPVLCSSIEIRTTQGACKHKPKRVAKNTPDGPVKIHLRTVERLGMEA